MSFNITQAMITAWAATTVRVTPYKNNVQIRAATTLENGDVLELRSHDSRRFWNTSDTTSQTYFSAGDKRLYLMNVVTVAAEGNYSYKCAVTYNESEAVWTDITVNVVLQPQVYFLADSFAQLNSSGVTLNVNNRNLREGDGLSVGDSVLATAELGRKFFIDGSGNPSIGILSTTGRAPYYFTLADDKQTATFLTVSFSARAEYWTLSSATEQSGSTVVGTNQVYLLTDETLKTFTASRYKTLKKWVQTGEQPTEGEEQTEIYDYGEYVLNLIVMPFNVPDDVIGLDEGIMLANYNTGVAAPKINTDNIVINLGSISVPKVSNNLLDYSNTVAMLHLPNINPFAIELEYVIGHTINVQYVIDVYTGKATVNVFSDVLDTAILTKSVDIGVNIPYATTLDAPLLSNSNIEVGGNNGVKTAFIELIKNNSPLADGFYSATVMDDSKIGVNKGFIQVENIDFNIQATSVEKADIINILANGVIIK